MSRYETLGEQLDNHMVTQEVAREIDMVCKPLEERIAELEAEVARLRSANNRAGHMLMDQQAELRDKQKAINTLRTALAAARDGLNYLRQDLAKMASFNAVRRADHRIRVIATAADAALNPEKEADK